MVLPGISLYRLVYLLPLNGITWYCIVLYCVVGFDARAVSRKTPIYFIFIINCVGASVDAETNTNVSTNDYLQLYSGDYVLVWGEPDEDG